MKRLFIALPLPRDALKVLAKYRDEMGRETPYLRWTPVANLHITVRFLGDVVEKEVPRVSEAVGTVCTDTKRFSLLCRGASYAPASPVLQRGEPRHRPATMVWLAFDESRAFIRLSQGFADALAPFAPAMDWKPWKAETPHVTLARFQKNVLPHQLRRLRRTALEHTAIPISSCVLMESHLTQDGPLYRIVSAHVLGSRAVKTD